MAKFISPLKHVKIAAPCSANWDEMQAFAGDRVRFCSQCQLNVYNLSAMKRSEAETLLFSTEGRLCVRFYRRADGTILTKNCPVGLRAIKQRVSWMAQFILGMVLGLLSNVGLLSLVHAREWVNFFAPQPTLMGQLVMPSEEHNRLEPFLGARDDAIEQGQAVQRKKYKIPKQKIQRLRHGK